MADRRVQLGGDLHAQYAVLAGQAALGDLSPVCLQQLVEARQQPLIVRHLHHQLLRGQGVRPHREAVEHDLDRHQHGSLDESDPVQARADGHAHGGSAPHTCGGGQPSDGVSVLEDNAGTQKGNTADHLRRDAGRIRTPQAVNAHQIHKGVLGQDHEQRRGAGDDAVGADTRLLLPLAALQSYQCAQRRRQHDSDEEFQIVKCGQCRFRDKARQTRQHRKASFRVLHFEA